MAKQSDNREFEQACRNASSFLFDFDGVLADSEPFFRRSWNEALEPWGHSIPEEDYWKYWSSLGHGLEGEIERCGLEGVDVHLARERQRDSYESYVNRGMVPLFPDTVRLLELLSSRHHSTPKPFCIASNTPYRLVRKILISGGAPVPLIVGGDNLPIKPSPDIFLRAASLLGSSPSTTLVFEDSWKGVSAAESGGFASVLVLNRYNSSFEIRSSYVISGIQQLLDVIPDRGQV
jgi:beta-phosphoglucomutase-like phosphatase (HAD superfamily)